MSADLLRVALAGQENIQVIGSATTVSELAALLGGSPDIALVASDSSRRESAAMPFLDLMTESKSNVRPIVISADMRCEDVISFLYRGARGLVCQAQTDFPVLMKCILCVSAGQVWANSEQLEQLLCSLTQPRSLRVNSPIGERLLSQREEQVLHLLARGLTNRDLAKALKLSEHTIKNHLFRIFDKLGVSSRMEAVLYAMSRTPMQNLAAEDRAVVTMRTGAA